MQQNRCFFLFEISVNYSRKCIWEVRNSASVIAKRTSATKKPRFKICYRIPCLRNREVIGNWDGEMMIEILGNSFPDVFNLPATGGRTRSSVIDRDKWFRRKRRSKLDAYMDTLSLIKKKSTMCVSLSCLQESCDSNINHFWSWTMQGHFWSLCRR